MFEYPVTSIKATFSYSDQIKFNEPVLQPGTPEWQHIAITNCHFLPAEKLAVICQKLY